MSLFATIALLVALMASAIGWRRLSWVWRQHAPSKRRAATLLTVGVPFLAVAALVAADIRIGPTPVDAMVLDGVVWPLVFIAAFFLTTRYYAAPATPEH